MDAAAGPVTVHAPDDVLALVGRVLGPSPWFAMEQERDDRFARAVEDWHWAHNEPERAAQGPFGGPITHAHLTLALVPRLFRALLDFTGGECMFYGYDRVRFPQAVPMGSRLRVAGEVTRVDSIAGGEQLAVDLRIDVEERERPACVAQSVWRTYHLGAFT